MRFLLRLVLLCFWGLGCAFAQSNLPACPSSGYFHNCFGTLTFPSGMKYVGEWKDNKYNGQGTWFYTNGSTAQGIWRDGVIINSFSFKTAPAQTVIPSSTERERTNSEVEAENKKRQEFEQQEKVRIIDASEAQKPNVLIKNVTPESERLSFDASKKKCTELGFKPATEGHGKCVLQLSK
jgi:hypothetical protein